MFFWKRKTEPSSTSAGWKSKAAEFVPLLGGLGLTVIAIAMARHRIAAVEGDLRRCVAPVEVVVAAGPIPAGTAFSEANLAKKPVPASGAGRRNVPAGEFELLLGSRSKGDIAAGDPVLWTDVEEPFDVEKFSQTIPEGRRAVTVNADVTASFSGLVRPGDRVDILCEGADGRHPERWLRNVPVIAVDRHFNRPAPNEAEIDVATLTVSLTPEEGKEFARASRDGRVHWFLRNPDEKPLASRVASRPLKERPEPIEVWKAGRKEPRARPGKEEPE